MKIRISALITIALVVSSRVTPAQETTSVPDTTVDVRSMLREEDHGGLSITSGKTYNRVEGLPVLLGPTYKNHIGSADLSLAAFGILRSAEAFHWDADNIGHKVTAELRYGQRRGFSFGAESFDVVAPIEPWQLTEPDAGLAAFFLKRDYFDYFGRHGGRAHVSAFTAGGATLTAGYSDERWSSRRSRDVFTLFRGNDNWRVNPRINDGRVHVADVSFDLDTRTSEINPWAGWFINANYEHGTGDFNTAGLSTGSFGLRHLTYGRGFLDVRRYNRISPKRQINGRLVLGGWLYGDPLPLERRFSVGGIGTLPGFDFRRVGIGTDVGQCGGAKEYEGRPAQCDRVALAQLEYRHELVSELFDVFNRNGIRVRGAVFRVKPTAVVFADAGRGWLVGDRLGTLRYPSTTFPGFDTYRTDVGAGLDLGILGVYVAKAVSSSKEPANFFVRIRDRF